MKDAEGKERDRANIIVWMAIRIQELSGEGESRPAVETSRTHRR